MKKYRKKPIVIEAVQLNLNTAPFILNMLGHRLAVMNTYCPGDGRPDVITNLNFYTLEGVMTAKPGDWIIKGIAGEFYPVKPEIFEATYEEVIE